MAGTKNKKTSEQILNEIKKFIVKKEKQFKKLDTEMSDDDDNMSTEDIVTRETSIAEEEGERNIIDQLKIIVFGKEKQ